MDRQEEIRRRKFAITVSLVVGILLVGGKILAYFITNSTAILADVLESLVHIFATGVAFYSVLLSLKPPDKSHPYGHGKVEYFSAGLEGMFIIIAALVIIVEAGRSLIIGRELQNLDIGVGIIALASIANFALGIYLIRAGKRTDSLAIVADGKHVLTDAYTSFGVVGGLFVVYITGWTILDPLIAVAVAVNILYSGGKLVRQSVGGLMNESDVELLKELVEQLNEHKEDSWIDVHQLRSWRAGDKHFIDFHLTVPYYWDVDRAHDEQLKVADALRDLLKGKAEVLIHLDPCRPACCSFCKIADCPVRADSFKGYTRWTVDHAINPPKYMPDSVTEKKD